MFNKVIDQRNAAQRLMGLVVVVAVQQFLGYLPDLMQLIENVAVQHLGLVGLVESIDIGVLRRLSGFNVVEGHVR